MKLSLVVKVGFTSLPKYGESQYGIAAALPKVAPHVYEYMQQQQRRESDYVGTELSYLARINKYNIK
jgi:hypothetical protein